MELTLQWLTETFAGKSLLTLLVSMVPVVELRVGIPFGIGTLGLPEWAAFAAAVRAVGADPDRLAT